MGITVVFFDKMKEKKQKNIPLLLDTYSGFTKQ